MARFLVAAKNLGNGGRIEGDVILTVDDSHQFGTQEDIRVWVAAGNAENDYPDAWYVIDVPGMPFDVSRRIMHRHIRAAVLGDPEFEAPDEADRIVELGPRRWQFGVQDRMPPPIRNQLRRDRFAVFEPYDQSMIDIINGYVIDRNGLDVFITDTPIDPVPNM